MTEEYKTTAIVIQSVDYKEKDKLITLFSLELGLITAVLKSVKSKDAKLKFAGQPFCFGEFILVKVNQRYTVKSVSVIDQFYDLTKDYDKFMLSSQLLQIIPSVLKEDMVADELFLITIKLLKELTYSNLDGKVGLIKFFLEVFSMTGYKISFDICTDCGKLYTHDIYLDVHLGNFVCSRCSQVTSKLLPPKVFDILKEINDNSIETLHQISAQNLTECLNVFITNFYYRYGKKLTDLIQYLNA